MIMFQITIDGPSGSGKSSIARKVAQELDILNFDADLITAAIAFLCFRKNVNPTIPEDVQAVIKNNKIEVTSNFGTMQVVVNGENITRQLANKILKRGQYTISKYGFVKKFIEALEKDLATKASIIVEGFNAGQELFPHAKYKFFLNADVEVRARRRYENLMANGVYIDYEKLLDETLESDRSMYAGEMIKIGVGRDSIFIDTTDTKETEVCKKICKIIKGN